MQVLVLAVQNAVPYDDARRRDLGRDAVPLDRRLARHRGARARSSPARLTSELPAGAAAGAGPRPGGDPAAARRGSTTPTSPRSPTRCSSCSRSRRPSCSSRSSLSWLIEERPLRKTVETAVGEAIGGPVDTDSMRELTRALSIAVGRERTLAFLERHLPSRGRGPVAGRVVGAAAPGGARRADARRPHGPPARRRDEAGARGRRAARRRPARRRAADRRRATRCASASSIARTDGLRVLVADWEPDENPELDPLLRRLAAELAAPA